MTPEQLAKKDTEDGHQAALFCKAAQNYDDYPELRWMFAIPNGGNRDARQGARLKMTGTRAGVWDIFLPVPISYTIHVEPISGVDAWAQRTYNYNGLWIEMKKPKIAGKQSAGTLQANQKEFQKHITHFSFATVVCYTWEEAWNAVKTYLDYISEDDRQKYREAMR